MRAFNDEALKVPCVWTVSAGPTDLLSAESVSLEVGVRGHLGALLWVSYDQRLVPKDGTNSDWQTYHLAGLHDMHLPPHAEVPIEVAYQALAEFLVTRARPTCVEWQEAEQD
ncbi:Immunity protein Imm1 [Actinokineospora globicatena]|nr:Immunity protein Imm1 [Actinokineospora globicatena]GLW77607.1 hypothetical protein Aglo01_20890 [Actinokineospora globicatena]